MPEYIISIPKIEALALFEINPHNNHQIVISNATFPYEESKNQINIITTNTHIVPYLLDQGLKVKVKKLQPQNDQELTNQNQELTNQNQELRNQNRELRTKVQDLELHISEISSSAGATTYPPIPEYPDLLAPTRTIRRRLEDCTKVLIQEIALRKRLQARNKRLHTAIKYTPSTPRTQDLSHG